MLKNEALEALETVFKEDVGGRGMGEIPPTGDYVPALEVLEKSGRIIILTGFCIKGPMVGETDGPLGTLSLAAALEKMGKEVLLVTDGFSGHLLETGKKIYGISAAVEEIPYDNPEKTCREIYDGFRPDVFVTIERPGKAANGSFHSMRGEDLSSFIPDSDPMLAEAAARGIPSVAVGDGGNELGMGRIRDAIIEHVPHGELIASALPADYLVIAGVSNWGGHGLAAGLSVLAGKDLLPDEAKEEEVLRAIVEAGSVDGCSKERTVTVDGLTLEKNLGILTEMRGIASEFFGRM